MVNAGLLTDIEVDRFLDLTRQPGFGYLPLLRVTAWGQRPVCWTTDVEIGLRVTLRRVEERPSRMRGCRFLC